MYGEMEKQAEYIKRIEITGLWGWKNIAWELRSDVNILAGINGIGKSTILNASVHRLDKEPQQRTEYHGGMQVKIVFEPEDATYVLYDVIRSFDRPLLHSDLMEKLADKNVRTELDWQVYQLQRRYLDYQVNIGNRIIELLTSGDAADREQAEHVSISKRKFQDMIDGLFSETDKRIDRRSNEIRFLQGDEMLCPYQLSSGEKQMLVILLTVLVQDNHPAVLFMDEPEVSLHIEWQQKMIALIRELNPHVQIILTTHSPAVIMDGWLDAVTEVSDISSNLHK